MRNLKISLKLVISFHIVIVLTVVVGVVGIVGMMNIHNGSVEMYERQSLPLAELAEARELFQRLRVQLRNIVLATGDIDELNSIQSDVISLELEFIRFMEDYGSAITFPMEMQLHNDILRSFYEFQTGMSEILSLAYQNANQDTLMEMVIDMRPPTDFVMDGLFVLTEIRVLHGMELERKQEKTFHTLLSVIIVVIALSVSICLILAFYMSGLISRHALKSLVKYPQGPS